MQRVVVFTSTGNRAQLLHAAFGVGRNEDRFFATEVVHLINLI
jgi:hypothetical protein